MTALSNPFDVLPDNLFNLFSAQGQSGLQRHYMAILLRIYEQAELNRFGLTREVVMAEIVAYLGAVGTENLPQALSLNGEADSPSPADRTDYASWLLRRMVDAGWLEREQEADYTEYIVLPDYAFTLLEALRNIQEQKPRQYAGQLYAAHQLLTNQGENFSPALAVSQAYENIRQVVRGLNELNQNIRRYTERISRNQPVAELLRLQFDDYAQALGPAYHALKTADHVSRYRRDIIQQLLNWQLDSGWLEQTADELATQNRQLTPARAADEISHYLRFIIDHLESLDPTLEEIDQRHTQYLRTSLRQIRYQLISADGSFKDRLIALARNLAQLQTEGQSWLPEAMPTFQSAPVKHPDANSFYTLPQRRAPFTPQPTLRPALDQAAARQLQHTTLKELGRIITPAKVSAFVGRFFNGHNTLHINQIPPETFAAPQDLPWLIYTIAYGNHPEVNYNLEPLLGQAVEIGPVRVKPFQLIKRLS